MTPNDSHVTYWEKAEQAVADVLEVRDRIKRLHENQALPNRTGQIAGAYDDLRTGLQLAKVYATLALAEQHEPRVTVLHATPETTSREVTQ